MIFGKSASRYVEIHPFWANRAKFFQNLRCPEKKKRALPEEKKNGLRHFFSVPGSRIRHASRQSCLLATVAYLIVNQ